jgi:putative tryptophan/tyrosine transport system substrate-binding protein
MRRRDFIAGLSSAVAVIPSRPQAQQKAMPVIGVLGLGQPENPAIALNLDGLRHGLAEAGLIEGKNVRIEYRWAHGRAEKLPGLAADLVARRVEVIVTEGGGPAASLAAKTIKTIPVVFHTPDAIADGIVPNLAHPGGNLTGVSLFAPELFLKEFQLLRELVPSAQAIGLLMVPRNQISGSAISDLDEMARSGGLTLHVQNADTDDEADVAYAALVREQVGGVVVRANATFADRLVRLAARYALPAAYAQRAFVEAGGLLSYGVNLPAVYVIKGRYAAKILQGARPGDLPIQQPDKFELLINMKTAKTLGLTVPQSLLARADEVIE